MTASLETQNGPKERQRLELSHLGSYSIGRGTDSEMQIADKAVSRQHCRVDYDGEFYWLVDCSSHNGTSVNGQRIAKCMLYDGDIIGLGHTRIRFSAPREEKETPPEQ
jgi:pSer/pThr/pTyr-binding forkhead associated (FHA) protein